MLFVLGGKEAPSGVRIGGPARVGPGLDGRPVSVMEGFPLGGIGVGGLLGGRAHGFY